MDDRILELTELLDKELNDPDKWDVTVEGTVWDAIVVLKHGTSATDTHYADVMRLCMTRAGLDPRSPETLEVLEFAKGLLGVV